MFVRVLNLLSTHHLKIYIQYFDSSTVYILHPNFPICKLLKTSLLFEWLLGTMSLWEQRLMLKPPQYTGTRCRLHVFSKCSLNSSNSKNNVFIYSLREMCPYSELFWSVFSHIWTEYGETLCISPYSGRMWGNTAQNNSDYGNFLRRDCCVTIC